MEKMKLGLKIVSSYQGFREVCCINGNQVWEKSVRDIRDDFKHVKGLNGNSNASVLFYSAIRTGDLYTVSRLIPGRQTDFISAWIFCPAEIGISGAELASIIEATRVEIFANEINEGNLQRLFSAEYPKANPGRQCVATTGSNYAVRYYGGRFPYSNLADLLDNAMSQPGNDKYNCIFLIESDSPMDADANCYDLSNEFLKKEVKIMAPEECCGFVPYLDGKPFMHERAVLDGAQLNIVWKRAGYKDISKVTQVSGANTLIDSISEKDIYKVIKYSDFHFRDEKFRPVDDDMTLFVDTRRLDPDQSVNIHLSRLKSCPVRVTSERFKTFESDIDLTSKSSYDITMKRKSFSYKCELPLDLDRNIVAECTAVIESDQKIDKCPIPGYTTGGPYLSSGSINRLYFKAPKNKKKTFITIIAAAAVGILAGVAVMGVIKDSKIKDLEQRLVIFEQDKEEEELRLNEEIERKKTPSAAVEYLNTHDVWNRDEMEEYEMLKGVWDAINNFDLNKLKAQKGTFKESRRYNDLCTNLEALGPGKMHAPNCSGEDININIDALNGKIRGKVENALNDNDKAPATRPTKPSNKPDAGKSANKQPGPAASTSTAGDTKAQNNKQRDLTDL